MDNFFSAEDLALLNEELEEMEHSAVEKEPEDTEMNASARRYQEIRVTVNSVPLGLTYII